MKVSHRIMRFILVTTHVAILGLLFQIAAFDHWGPHGLDVYGIEGSASHVHSDHCHGDVSGCAGGGAATAGAVAGAGNIRLPSPAFLKVSAPDLEERALIDPYLGAPLQPPRSSQSI